MESVLVLAHLFDPFRVLALFGPFDRFGRLGWRFPILSHYRVHRLVWNNQSLNLHPFLPVLPKLEDRRTVSVIFGNGEDDFFQTLGEVIRSVNRVAVDCEQLPARVLKVLRSPDRVVLGKRLVDEATDERENLLISRLRCLRVGFGRRGRRNLLKAEGNGGGVNTLLASRVDLFAGILDFL